MSQTFSNLKKVYNNYGREYKSALIKIFILENGQISDEEKLQELLKTNKYYKKLCETQLIERDW